MTLERIIQQIDFAQLKEDKLELLRVMDLVGVDEEKLEGILYVIDLIQDVAVDVLGYPESEVFNLNDEEL